MTLPVIVFLFFLYLSQAKVWATLVVLPMCCAGQRASVYNSIALVHFLLYCMSGFPHTCRFVILRCTKITVTIIEADSGSQNENLVLFLHNITVGFV